MSETTAAVTTTKSGDGDTLARLASQRTRFRTERDQARKDLEAARAEVTRLNGENATLANKADSSASLKRVQELEGKLREIDHRKVFDRVAKAKGAPEDALDLIYQHSGYKAEAPEADEEAIAALVDQTKAKPGVSRLFGQPEAPDPDAPLHPVKPAAGSGQSGKKSTGEMIALAHDDERWSDVKYVMGNYDKITAASKARLERGEV